MLGNNFQVIITHLKRILTARVAVFILLTLVLIQTLGAARYMSLTVDETAHLPAGYSYWKTGDFRLGRENPPLIKLIASFPLLFLNPKLPVDHPTWNQFEQFGFGKQFFFHSNSDADQLLFWGRVPIILLSLLLAFFVFKWAKELYGEGAALFALFLYAFEPNILANSSLSTLDLGLTTFMFVATYYFWHFIKEFNNRKLVLTGVIFGLALAAKFSALLLIPVYLLLIFVKKKYDHAAFKFPLLSALIILFLAFGIIFACYGFKVSPLISPIEPLGKHTLTFAEKFSKSGVGRLVFFLAREVPLPAGEWFRGLISQMLHAREGHDAFLMGAHSKQGWWYYYPIAFVLKTPLSLLILVLISSLFFRHGKSRDCLDEYFLIIPMVLILLGGMISKIDIGIRYILPLYPFLFVFVSRLLRVAEAAVLHCSLSESYHKPVASLSRGELKNSYLTSLKSRMRLFFDSLARRKKLIFRVVIVLLSLWYFVGTTSIYPHYLAYFNELIGGPNNGYKYLVDSNLDWGQELKGLKRYIEKNGIGKVKLAYFGTANPDYYKIPYEKITEEEMHKYTPGIYAISATELQNALVEDKTRFAWIKKYKPKDKIGYSIFIYEIR